MKVRIQDQEIPFPLTTLRGRLRLSGLPDVEISQLLAGIKKYHSNRKVPTESELTNFIEASLKSHSPQIIKNYETLSEYEHLRGESNQIPPIILALEGASATGKSMLAIDLVQDLVSTRFISTDTIRLILRRIYSKKEYPELHCHTYQAFKHKETGNSSLDSVVRGYIAQCELISPPVIEMVKQIHAEGAIAVLEGVHLQPGSIAHLGKGTIEILINPNEETHKAMFTSKYVAGKLKSVSKDSRTREEEFQSTRKIQDYMILEAKKHDLSIIAFESYEDAHSEIIKLVIDKIEQIVGDHQ